MKLEHCFFKSSCISLQWKFESYFKKTISHKHRSWATSVKSCTWGGFGGFSCNLKKLHDGCLFVCLFFGVSFVRLFEKSKDPKKNKKKKNLPLLYTPTGIYTYSYVQGLGYIGLLSVNPLLLSFQCILGGTDYPTQGLIRPPPASLGAPRAIFHHKFA